VCQPRLRAHEERPRDRRVRLARRRGGDSLVSCRGENSAHVRCPGPCCRRRSGALGLLLLELRTHLGRAAALALLRDDLAVHEELAAPDSPRLAPRECTVEAVFLDRALGAEGLRTAAALQRDREE